MENIINQTQDKRLEILKDAKIFTWESGITTTTKATQNFYNNHKRFYAIKHGKIMEFYSLEGELLLVTSPIQELKRTGGYVRIETANSTYQLWEENFITPTTEPDKVTESIPVQPIQYSDIRELTSKIGSLYPIESSYGSKCSLYQRALSDNIITPDEFKKAAKYYDRLWDYTGD